MSFNDWYDKNYSTISAMNTGTRGALEYLWNDILGGKVKMSCMNCAHNGKSFRHGTQELPNTDICNQCFMVLSKWTIHQQLAEGV